MNKWSKNLLFVGSLPIFISPIVIIASCSSSNNAAEQNKIAFKSTQIQLDGLSDKNANDYAEQNKLKQLIFDNREKIFNNIPADFSVNNIFVSEIVPNTQTPGNLKAQVEIKNGNTVLIEKTLIIFKGFQKNVPGLNGTEIQLKDQTNVDPKTYKEMAKLKSFVFSQKDQIFTNLPNDLAENQINIEQDSIKIRSGALILTLSVRAVNTSDPDLIMPTKIKLTGFMATFAFKDETVKLSGLSDQAAADITEDKLKQIIVDKKTEIFDTIPIEDITKEQVLIDNKKQKSIVANGTKLSARIAIKSKVDQSLLIDYETIVLNGFKIAIELKSQNVDLVSKLENGEENLDQYLENNYSKLKALIYKNRDSFFNNWPDEFNENSFTITEAKVHTTEKGKLIVKIKVADPNNGGSDLINESEVIIGGFFDLKSFEKILLNLNYGEEYVGKYFDPSSGSTNEQKELMAKLIFDHRSEIFINTPKNLQINQIHVKEIGDDSRGDLRINFFISEAENNTNNLLKEQSMILGGFFNSKLPIIKLTLSDTEKPKSQYKDPANGDQKMKDLIYNHKDTIFINIPKGFEKSWITIISSASDVSTSRNQLAVGIKIAKESQEIIPNIDLIFDGFTA